MFSGSSSTSEDVAVLCLMLFGLSVLVGGLIYLLCRIFCYDFWASCCSRFKEKVTPSPPGSSSHKMEKGSTHRSLVQKMMMNAQHNDKNRWAKRRLSEDFLAGQEDDQIIYSTDPVVATMPKRDSIFSQTLALPDTYGRQNPWGARPKEGPYF
ncbi:hypothetical protein TCAL_14375 [Tigriopus californicus]|uniref:Uncharacterized protein n=1 Tax=Tigriopus californicus TaxID=6832 RepID=A0A553PKY0_TIGCA|nr:hypothetical protein TCAL_14375 [Tigriopus californicus]